jgi:restriction system protein
MAIPDFQTLMLPVLKFHEDGQVHTSQDLIEDLAKTFSITEEERNEPLASGRQARFDNRVYWARIYLNRAGLLDFKSRGNYVITEQGRRVLDEQVKKIDMAFLKRFQAYVDWKNKSARPTTKCEEVVEEEADARTPEELIASGHDKLKAGLAADILEHIKSCSPRFFERLVLQLLLKMGYGGSIEGAGQVVGKTGDGGIDGIIKEDKLGLDIIYIQAKRWEGVVSVVEVRNFSGSLDPHGAKKGVFITTSSFTKDARDFVTRLGEKKIVLIDGFELAQLMIDHDIGVSTVEIFPIKRLDSDYFEE